MFPCRLSDAGAAPLLPPRRARRRREPRVRQRRVLLEETCAAATTPETLEAPGPGCVGPHGPTEGKSGGWVLKEVLCGMNSRLG